MVGCASASTYQGSTRPRLRSASGLREWDAARVHLIATFTCRTTCQTQLLRTTLLGAPLGLHYPQAARVRPSGMYTSCIYLRAMFSTHRACYLVPVHGTFSSWMSQACALKGGCLSIATQGSYRLSGPHPLVCPRHRAPAYQRRLRPAREPGPEDVEHRHLAKFAGTHSKIRPRARRNPP